METKSINKMMRQELFEKGSVIRTNEKLETMDVMYIFLALAGLVLFFTGLDIGTKQKCRRSITGLY